MTGRIHDGVVSLLPAADGAWYERKWKPNPLTAWEREIRALRFYLNSPPSESWNDTRIHGSRSHGSHTSSFISRNLLPGPFIHRRWLSGHRTLQWIANGVAWKRKRFLRYLEFQAGVLHQVHKRPRWTAIDANFFKGLDPAQHQRLEGEHNSTYNQNCSGRRDIHFRFPHSPIRIRSGPVMLRKEVPADDTPIMIECKTGDSIKTAGNGSQNVFPFWPTVFCKWL